MTFRNIMLIVLFFFATATIFCQSARFAGKWGTDGAAIGAAMTVMLELRVDARNNVTGSITQYAIPRCGFPNTIFQISSGTIVGNVVTFATTIPASCPTAGAATAPRESGTQVAWTGTLANDGSLSVTGVAASARDPGVSPPAAPAAGGDSSRAGGSRNPLGTPTNPLPRGGDIAVRGGSTGGTSGAAVPNFPSMIMHRL